MRNSPDLHRKRGRASGIAHRALETMTYSARGVVELPSGFDHLAATAERIGRNLAASPARPVSNLGQQAARRRHHDRQSDHWNHSDSLLQGTAREKDFESSPCRIVGHSKGLRSTKRGIQVLWRY